MTRFLLIPLAATLCLLGVSPGLYADTAALDHVIEVDLDSDDGVIEIRDRVRVSGVRQFRYQLADWLTRVDLRLEGDRLEPRRQGGVHVVDLPDTGLHYLDFVLSGTVPARNEVNSRELSSSSGSDGSFLPGYDNWIPHTNGALLRYRLDVSLPNPQRAVSTVKLVRESFDGHHYRVRFETTRPSEAPSLFSGPYRIEQQSENGLDLRAYFHEGLESHADAYLEAVKLYIDRYQRSVGDYPYASFDVVSAPLPVGLGFPGLTYVDRRIVPLPFMRTRSLAHEVLHNWWGNAVGIDYASGNWAEGLTTYMADYALERDKGENEARSMRVKWLRDYAALPVERDRPVRAFRSRQHQAGQVIGYNKVAFIFHMLSREIGQAAFDLGLRRFWEGNKFRVAGWDELEAAFEEASSRDLGWFFSQWLDRPGAPRLSLGEHLVTRVEEGYRTEITVLQPVVGYRFQLPVMLMSDGGEERREITVSDTGTRLEWFSASKPRYIHFDPDSDLFRRLEPGETPPILRDITLDSKAMTIVAAGDGVTAEIAVDLATRLLDARPTVVEPEVALKSNRPLMVIATNDLLPELLAGLALQQPAAVRQTGPDAAAWTARLMNGNPVLVISADDAVQLKALLRPLPHYGGQSYVLFASGRAIERGIWPMRKGALYRDLETVTQP